MTVREILAEGKRLLESPCEDALIDTPALDAALLLAETLGVTRAALISRNERPVTEAERECFFRLLARRRSGECIAYILGRREFRFLEFSVNRHVLVPRPDSEILVEAVLETIDKIVQNDETGHAAGGAFPLLDLCTGSGALALSLKSERPFLDVTASDVSQKALETARANAARLLRGKRARFIQSDLFDAVSGKFNIIVSNPPYVPSGELSRLAPEVRREPRLALDGGEDGLDLIRRIIPRAPDYLLPGGSLFLEAAPGQMPSIKRLLESAGFCAVALFKDLGGRERVISGTVRGNQFLLS